MHQDYFYKSQIKPLTTTLSMNQPSNKRNSLQACYKSDGKSEGRFEEIERKLVLYCQYYRVVRIGFTCL